MTLKELCRKAHQNAKDKGFWGNKNIPEKIMLVVTELAEAVEALRRGERQKNVVPDSTEWVKDSFEDEIADTFIRLADLCGHMDIDIEWQIKKKMAYNKTRPAKHGKEF